MEAAVSSSLGAMGPVLRKLDLLLYHLRKALRDGIELLKEDLQEISSALVELSTLETPTLRAKCWMAEARELSYLIEDFVDDMMWTRSDADSKVRSVCRHRHRVGRVKIAQLPQKQRRGTRIARITQLRDLVRQASERHERYQLDAGCTSSRYLNTGHMRAPTDAANLFGIENSRIKLIEMLTVEEEQQLKVVSIVGPAGVGKTTLAKKIFYELGGQFELRAFVSASRKLDMRRFLGSILSQLWPHHQLASDAGPVQNLIDNIQEQLQDKRYFIVIDNIWEKTAWDIVSGIFPMGNNCSRIIGTSENMNVALECCGHLSNNILKMKPLGIQDSANLFFGRVFGSEQQCPDELKEVSYAVIRKCGGLPLALINIAGLLASHLEHSGLWYHVHARLCSILDTSHTIQEIQKEILILSYNSLPHCLKTCLLYFSMYPEGYMIRKAHLARQWIAEGFIDATEAKDAEEIADIYFEELINRGMIEPAQIDCNDEVLSCTVHHVVLDLITQSSKKEEFISAIDCSQTITGLSTKAHRLSFHFSSAKYAKRPARITMLQIRSLGFFGLIKCMPSIVDFKHLRVLILEFWGDHDGQTRLNLSRICTLHLLRYLKISSDIMVELPAQMSGQQYLETLDIDARICAVPLDIIHLPSLMHLSLRCATELPDRIGCIRSLSTLQYFDLGHNSENNVWSIGKLENLRHLHLTCSTVPSDEHLKRNLVALASTVGNLANLKSLTLALAPGALATTISIDGMSAMSSPACIQKLELLPPIVIFYSLPKWIGLLHKLCVLKIAVANLQRNDICSLTGLPELTVLSLHVRIAPVRRIVLSCGEFPVLKYFEFMCGVLCLAFEPEALPNLRRLQLGFNVHRGERHAHFLPGIEHLLNLKDVVARIGAATGVQEKEKGAMEHALNLAIRKHPRFNNNFLKIESVDWVEEEYGPLERGHDIPGDLNQVGSPPSKHKVSNILRRGLQHAMHGVGISPEDTVMKQLSFVDKYFSRQLPASKMRQQDYKAEGKFLKEIEPTEQTNHTQELKESDSFGSDGGMELALDPVDSTTASLWNSSTGGVRGVGTSPFGFTSTTGTTAGEHPYGEHTSRTLFVRNINSNVEDTELHSLFEQYGDIQTLCTATKHLGFIMISYFDIRSARNAMLALQNKPMRRRKMDIHFSSTPKAKPSDKNLNQGTLTMFNLDPLVSNEEVLQIFGAYGEVKEIRKAPNERFHRLIEFYDVRAAEAALVSLNKSEIAGRQIKLEPTRPSGAHVITFQDVRKEYEVDLDKILKGHDSRTTLMIKNIPNKYTSKMVLTAIDEAHKGTYDFFYLPIDFRNKCNVGYAFINMISPLHVVSFFQNFNGKRWEKINSWKVASLAYARIQGRSMLISHFQNSSLVNEDKRGRPIVFYPDGLNITSLTIAIKQYNVQFEEEEQCQFVEEEQQYLAEEEGIFNEEFIEEVDKL